MTFFLLALSERRSQLKVSEASNQIDWLHEGCTASNRARRKNLEEERHLADGYGQMWARNLKDSIAWLWPRFLACRAFWEVHLFHTGWKACVSLSVSSKEKTATGQVINDQM